MLKRKRLLPILLIMACMLVTVLYAAWIQSGDLLSQVRFQDSTHGQALDLFYDADRDSYVLFLPPFTEPQDITHDCPSGVRVEYNLDTALEESGLLTISAGLRSQQLRLRLMRTSAISSTFIHAEEGLIDYLNQDKGNTRDVVVTMVDAQGTPMLRSTATMYGRGNGSWEGTSKRPYNLEFPQEISVGSFTDVTKLCLLAEYSDESKLRNSLAYYAGKELGVDNASPYPYTNLYVNGEYMGLYGIVTKQEYKKHLEEDNIQAVFEIASGQNRVEFESSLGWRINVMQGSRQQVQLLIADFEEALIQDDWEQIESFIDAESVAQKYALEEFLANLDLAYASQYFYVDGAGKIHAMLPWDYDFTLGSSYEYYNNLQAWELKVYRNTNSWYYLLMEQFPFRGIAAEVWKNQFTDEFLQKLEDHLLQDIEAIGSSWTCDKLRWKQEPPFSQYDTASGVEELEGFYDLFRTYFYQRRDFLVNYYTHWWDYSHLHFYGIRWGNLIFPNGANLWDCLEGATILDVNVPGEKFLGWYLGDTPLEEVAVMPEWGEVQGYSEVIERSYTSEPFWWLRFAVTAAFGAMTLGLFLVARKDWRKKPRVRDKIPG